MSGGQPSRARILRWSAWAPGLETQPDWDVWASAPQPLAAEGHPDAHFLPPMLRRRCSPLTRILLTAAFDCLHESERGDVRTVFASRHGSVNESLGLLERIVRKQRLSPAKFSHTVHNAQAGLFCIAAGNRHASSSLAAREDTFACGYLEALTHLEREPTRPVLYVMGDERLVSTFAHLVDEPPGSYGVALLLGSAGQGPGLAFDLAEAQARAELKWPDAAEFVRWLLSDEPVLQLGRFRWTRG
jgi:hypothetical protein